MSIYVPAYSDLPAYTLSWSPNAALPDLVIPQAKPLRTPANQVWKDVQKWYSNKGEGVPMDEANACLKAIKEEKAQLEADAAALAAAQAEAVKNPTKPKAEYGTPDFWKDYWAKKKAAGFVSKKDQKIEVAKSKKTQ